VRDLQKIKAHYLLKDCEAECPCLRIRSSRERKARARQVRKQRRARADKSGEEKSDVDEADTDTTSARSSDESDATESDLDDPVLAEVVRKMLDFREGGTRAAKVLSGKWYHDPDTADAKDKKVYNAIVTVLDDIINNIARYAHPFSTCSAEGFHQERCSDNPKS
jgi:hypothetical protein